MSAANPEGLSVFVVILLAFVMIIVFSVLKVPLAYLGIFLAIIGHCARSGAKDAKDAGKGIAQAPSFKLHIQGSTGIILVFGGIILAILQIWNRGPLVYQDAVAYAKGEPSKEVQDQIDQHQRERDQSALSPGGPSPSDSDSRTGSPSP